MKNQINLQQIDQIDLSILASLEGLTRFVALSDMVSSDSLVAVLDKLEQWTDQAEYSEEVEFFLAAHNLLSCRLLDRVGEDD